MSIGGQIVHTEKEESLGVGWTTFKVEGIKELCKKEGDGCTAYSCTTTN